VCRERIEKVRKRLAGADLEGVVLVPGANLRYLTGINSLLLERPFLLFIPGNGEVHLIAPTLESGPYLRSPLNIVVHSWDDSEGPSHAFGELVAKMRLGGKWGFEGRVPFGFIHELQKHAHPDLENAEPILQGVREIKEPAEILLLQRAATILSRAFTKIPDMLGNGLTELELARKISQTIYSNGGEFVDDVLVQSGEYSADPHHLPSTRKLRGNESIVVDTACTFAGYYADITRTFIIGKNREFENMYENVLASQEAAIKISSGGVAVGSIDDAARSYLKRCGLDRFFIHRTGHGLGLEVHEAPYIVSEGEEIVRERMVFTIEPGVYVTGKMGIRIEDNVAATEHGCKVLTKALPKEFEWWK
jgi:Xaa-Pro dipeptidase